MLRFWPGEQCFWNNFTLVTYFYFKHSRVAEGLPGASAPVSLSGGRAGVSSCGKCLFSLITTLKRGRNSGSEALMAGPFSYTICKQTEFTPLWLIWLTGWIQKNIFLIHLGEATGRPVNNQKNVQTSLSLYCLILMGLAQDRACSKSPF